MSRKRRPQPPAVAGPALDLAQVVEAQDRAFNRLGQIRLERQRLDIEEAEAVAQLRATGATWSQIATATGLSLPGAHKRFRPSTNEQ